MARILVSDGEHRSSLAVVRSLGRAGHHVVVTGRDYRCLAAASRYCAELRQLPSAEVDPVRYGAVLEWLVKWEEIDVVVPTTDASTLACLDLRERAPRTTVPLPTRDAYETATNKRRLLEVAGALGLPVPRQHVVGHPAEGPACAVDFARGVGYPVILKPSRSLARGPIGARWFGVQIANGPNALAEGLRALDPMAYPVLVQERIVGDGLGTFLLMRDGRTLARFGHKRLRELPPTGGMSTYRESARRKDIEEYAERLLSHLGWTGVAMVEFKEDRATGTPYLMEVNARFWGSLQLAIDAGVDFPEMLVRSALGKDVEPVTTYREGVRSRWLMGDLDYLIWMLRAPPGVRRIHPMLPSRARAVGRVLVPWRPREHHEVLRLSDPGPFLAESASWARRMLRRAHRRTRTSRERRARPRRATTRSARASLANLQMPFLRGR